MPASPNEIFSALADPTRGGIFERLSRDGEHTVRVLTDHACVSQPAVSKQLGILKLAGLVSGRRDGRQTHCRAEPQALEAVDRLDEPLPRVLARPGSSARKIC